LAERKNTSLVESAQKQVPKIVKPETKPKAKVAVNKSSEAPKKSSDPVKLTQVRPIPKMKEEVKIIPT
jgi:hypothetical protein